MAGAVTKGTEAMGYVLVLLPPFIGVVQIAIQVYALKKPNCCTHK